MRPFSRHMRDVLIEHIDGPVMIDVRNAIRQQTVRALIARGLLGWRRSDRGWTIPAHPRETWITDDGREALAAVLADYADALVRANFAASIREVADAPQVQAAE